jgi:prevent-host-death family protein
MTSTTRIKTVTALEARTQLGQLMKDVQKGGARVLVEKSGVPMVGIISADEFKRLVAEREARFEVVDRIRGRLPAIPEAKVSEDVRAAVKHARRRRRG